MWNLLPAFCLICSVSVSSVEIAEPADGGVYYNKNLNLRVIVENDAVPADSVSYTLNGGAGMPAPFLDTDWYTYMRGSLHHGFSGSCAPRVDDTLWTAPVTGYSHEFCAPVVVGGVVYYVSDEKSRLYALDAAGGSILWEYDVVDHVDDAVTVLDGKVYVPADSAWCLDAEAGSRIWAFKGMSDSKMNGTPAVGGGAAYFTNTPRNDEIDSCRVYALDSETGREIWSKGFPHYTTGSLTLSESRLLLPTDGGPLYCLDPSTGAVLWTNTDAEGGYWDSSPTVDNGIIYIGGRDTEDDEDIGCAHAIDLYSGELIWETSVADHWLGIESTPALYDGKVYVGYTGYFQEGKGGVAALDERTGRVLWKVKSKLHGSVGIAGGVVYWAENYGDGIYAADAETGDIIWRYTVAGAPRQGMQSSPAITNGVMYIAATDGRLYAFGSGIKYTHQTGITALPGENVLTATAWDSLGNVIGTGQATFTVKEPSPGIDLTIIWPNPFPTPGKDFTYIEYRLSKREAVKVRIYDVAGRLVAELDQGVVDSGDNIAVWNGKTSRGETAESGIYFCEVAIPSGSDHKKICVLR